MDRLLARAKCIRDASTGFLGAPRRARSLWRARRFGARTEGLRAVRGVAFAAALAACGGVQRGPERPAALSALGWLRGAWCGPVRGGTFCETWRARADGSLEGEGETRSAGVRREGERLRIEARGAEVYYVAAPDGAAPTSFRLTRWSPGEALFENPAHDFPTRIHYTQRPGGLTAVVESDARRITFELTRREGPASEAPDPPCPPPASR